VAQPYAEERALHGEWLQANPRLLARLTTYQALVLYWRWGMYGERLHTMRQAGERLGCSRERIRQLEAEAVARLRQAVQADILTGMGGYPVYSLQALSDFGITLKPR
jgi:DNA-directed RNA polymerase sigma subunit (sigma70/sigma32)